MSIEEEVRRFVVSAFAPDVAAEELPDDLDLLDTGVVDSLRLLRLIEWVASRYAIAVDDRDISPAQFHSVAAIAGFVRETTSLV